MKRLISSVLLVISIVGFLTCAINAYVLFISKDYMTAYNKVVKDNNVDYDIVLVLGAGLRNDGTPSDMLKDRLNLAINLYREGIVSKIILSGDKTGDYDEVSAMKLYCTNNGVNENDIESDFWGFSTYESMYNVKTSNPSDKIIVVTQNYHLYRAVYIGRELNLDVIGVNSDYNRYRGAVYRGAREAAARVKDFFVVTFN